MSIPKYIFRMVHWQNVEYILSHGMCCRGHEKEDQNYINIGMRSLIADRHEHPIPIEGKGNLGEYVPFYFAGHSPMLYLIRDGKSGVERRPQEDIVFILCKYETIKEEGMSFLFTDRNAKIAVANFYEDETDFDKLDWESIKTRNWASDNSNLSRRDLKQAEFLIHQHVPVNCIHALIVKTSLRKSYFVEIIRKLELPIAVHVDSDCKLYY
jgi:hypothetical protein